jgi:hypothetical protein
MRRDIRTAALVLTVLLAGTSGAHAGPGVPPATRTANTDSASRAPRPADAGKPEHPAAARELLNEAWWTGSMLAQTAATLPRGHVAVESYLYDVSSSARVDARGTRQPTTRSDGFGSLTYAMYGLTDRVMIGLAPVVGYTRVRGGPSSSGVGFGDLTLHAQYRLTQFHEGGRTPTTSLVVQETLPTGRYDRLGDHPGDGIGSGARTTTLGLFSQMYFWLPTGRILRMRLDASRTFPGGVDVSGVSVYGTHAGFRGHAEPGRALAIDLSAEYSLTRQWVLAIDANYQDGGSTRVSGREPVPGSPDPAAVDLNSGTARTLYVAPAVEYSWTANLGVLVGVRLTAMGRNGALTLTPAVAINFVH